MRERVYKGLAGRLCQRIVLRTNLILTCPLVDFMKIVARSSAGSSVTSASIEPFVVLRDRFLLLAGSIDDGMTILGSMR